MPRHSMLRPASLPAARRSAFTLVELLVVITIIGMLMALLMPAVQSAREAGRRTACSNNLVQLALAAVRSDEQSGFIPGWRNKHPAPANNTTVSWPVPLLPFMERSDVYKNWAQGGNAAPLISFFMCPSSPPGMSTQPWLAYAGNCGSGSNTNKWDGVMLSTNDSPPVRISFEDVANGDGGPFTILLSEKCGAKISDSLQAQWNVSPGNFAFSNGPSSIPGFGLVGSPPTKIVNSQIDGAPGYRSQPSSNHAGGVVTAFCDSHVGFLKDTISAQVYAQLLSSNGGSASNLSKTTWNAGAYVLRDSDYQ
jgi:prepilin-type N-terminal cleavage/methylation domain-containing protein